MFRTLQFIIPINNKMKKFIPFIAAASVAAVMVSCSGNPKFVGQWASTAPYSMARDLPVSIADAQLTLDFGIGEESTSTGPVTLSSVIDLTQPVEADTTFSQAYEVSVTANSTVTGTWLLADDDDDVVLSFDMSTLSVSVDTDGVAFSQNLLTGAQQPVLDSLTTVTAQRWQSLLTAAVKRQLADFAELDDVEVSDNGNILTFEIKTDAKHDRKLTFNRLLQAK